MDRHVLILAGLLSVILVLGCAGCSELPVEERGVGSGVGDGGTVVPTATPDWVQVATPIRTAEPEATASPTEPENKPETPGYIEIYSNLIYLLYDVIALKYDLKVPAMIIDLKVKPDMITDSNEIFSEYGRKQLIIIKKTYPDPRADLIVTIFDVATGEVVEEYDFEQFSKEQVEKSITIRYPGFYQVEMTGNNVEVGITISVPEVNIADTDTPFSLS